jgi:hypothetical protein
MENGELLMGKEFVSEPCLLRQHRLYWTKGSTTKKDQHKYHWCQFLVALIFDSHDRNANMGFHCGKPTAPYIGTLEPTVLEGEMAQDWFLAVAWWFPLDWRKSTNHLQRALTEGHPSNNACRIQASNQPANGLHGLCDT